MEFVEEKLLKCGICLLRGSDKEVGTMNSTKSMSMPQIRPFGGSV